MKHKPWKTRSSRPIHKNPWIDVREDVAEMPDGRKTIYDVIALLLVARQREHAR